MNLNVKKTKESSPNCNVFDSLIVADVIIERVDVFKLFSVYINPSLK